MGLRVRVQRVQKREHRFHGGLGGIRGAEVHDSWQTCINVTTLVEVCRRHGCHIIDLILQRPLWSILSVILKDVSPTSVSLHPPRWLFCTHVRRIAGHGKLHTTRVYCYLPSYSVLLYLNG